MRELKIPRTNELEKSILRVSTELFLTQGYENTTIRQIAQTSGIGRGHLYYYFRKKEDILIHIFKEILNKIYNDLISNNDDKMEILQSYALIQSVFIHTLVYDKNLFRIYLEGSNVDIVRRESQNILIDLVNKKCNSSKYNLSEKDIRFSVIIGYSGECELLKRYYNRERDFDINSIVRTVVSTRLLLLNIANIDEINEIIEKSINEAKNYEYDDIITKLHTFEF